MRIGQWAVLTALVLAIGCASSQQREERKQREQEKKTAAADAKRQKAEDKRMAAEQRRLREEDRLYAENERREAKKEEAEDRDALGHEIMRDERQVRAVDRFVLAQAAQGAREDATLNDAHFDGQELNALGRSKLMLIARAAAKSPSQPVLVYVNAADAQPRIDAVQSYWKATVFGDMALQLKAGANDDVTTPARVGIKGLEKMEKMKTTDRNASNSSSGNAAGMSGSPSPTP